MKNLISLIIFLLFAWLGIWWYYSCDWCKTDASNDTQVVEETPDPEAEALAKKAYEDSIAALNAATVGLLINDTDGQEVFSFSDNLQINNANGSVLIPESLQGFENKIVDYLGQHQDQELIIEGYANNTEKDNSSDYGLSRANFVKNIISEAGINPDRIITKVKNVDYSYNSEGVYNGGVSLNFHTLDQTRLAEVEKSIEKRTLYSGSGQKTFKPDPTLINYALDLKNYLTKYPDRKVTVTGHTDNIGSTKSNLWYGKQRANNVKKYLVSQGIAKEKISASSKGESDPIAPNDTEEGRAKNRRIEITVN